MKTNFNRLPLSHLSDGIFTSRLGKISYSVKSPPDAGTFFVEEM